MLARPRATSLPRKGLKREQITGREHANRAHHEVETAVRSFIIGTLGGTPPEHLPTPPASLAQLQLRERKTIAGEQARDRQPSLFDAADSK